MTDKEAIDEIRNDPKLLGFCCARAPEYKVKWFRHVSKKRNIPFEQIFEQWKKDTLSRKI